MCNACGQCMSILKLQGVIAAASFAMCLYTCYRGKRTLVSTEDDVSSTNSCSVPEVTYVNREPCKQPKTSANKARSPRSSAITARKVNINADIVLVERLLEMSGGITTAEINEEIARQEHPDLTNTKQCSYALAYEFVGVMGSEKVRQEDATRLISTLAKVTDLKYVETMVVLACIDETVLKAFDPMTILAALCLISAGVEKNDPSDILSILTEHRIGAPTALGAATAVRCSIDASTIGPKDVERAINTLRTACTRRSPRIRKLNK
ncbi:hypothetical protein X943_001876 [Babesia divergens]|uniref:Uncharacterized protein n=1 Tax=Babesia divergens TaxID=32595 RepID=A0AAD9GJK3_BABDI|nr:hypothetical protein X943_001876 [Babesia divergens]